SFRRNNVYQRTSLNARKYTAVKVLGKFFSAKYEAASRSSKRLVSCRCNKFAMWYWCRMKVCYDQSGDMSYVRHDLSPYAPRDLADPFEVNNSRICRCTADKQLRSMLFCQFLQFIVIDLLRFTAHTIV